MSSYKINFKANSTFLDIVNLIEEDLIEISISKMFDVKSYVVKTSNLNNTLKKISNLPGFELIYVGLDPIPVPLKPTQPFPNIPMQPVSPILPMQPFPNNPIPTQEPINLPPIWWRHPFIG